VDPSDRERINLGSGSPHGGTDEPRHDNGTPGEGDRWLRSVLENSSEIIKIVDPDGTLRYASPAFDRILGYDPEEAIGTSAR
jgi:PAS domain-containing protein